MSEGTSRYACMVACPTGATLMHHRGPLAFKPWVLRLNLSSSFLSALQQREDSYSCLYSQDVYKLFTKVFTIRSKPILKSSPTFQQSYKLFKLYNSRLCRLFARCAHKFAPAALLCAFADYWRLRYCFSTRFLAFGLWLFSMLLDLKTKNSTNGPIGTGFS